MSATQRDLHYVFTVEKYERLPAYITDEAERSGCTADDVVTDWLDQVMRAAGERFITDHPDWFRGSLI